MLVKSSPSQQGAVVEARGRGLIRRLYSLWASTLPLSYFANCSIALSNCRQILYLRTLCNS